MAISKRHILTFLKQKGASVHYLDIQREIGGKNVRRELKNLLVEMVDNGEVVRMVGNSYALAGPVKTVRGRITIHRDGYGFVAPEGGGEDIFIPSKFIKGALHGDQVEVVSAQSRMGRGKLDGRVVNIVERATSRIVGRYEETGRGAIVIPEDHRLNLVVKITANARGRAEDGHQVVVELTAYPVGGRPAEGRVVEVLGWPDDPEVEVQSVIRRFDLPHIFSRETLSEANGISDMVSAEDLKGRVDLRKMTTVTIDGETARDFDDAVALSREGDGFRLWVSIADVSHYVQKDSYLDREAYLRGTSVYFPDRCIPMLPERLSNGICSLNPHVERLTMTAEMLFDRSGVMRESSFYPSVIQSSARLTYTEVKKVIVDGESLVNPDFGNLVGKLLDMKELALCLQAMRRKRGSIDFDLPEPEIIVGLTGRTEGIVRAERNLAHQLIEEFMLAANEAVANFVSSRNVPFLYRIHENPDPAKLHTFQEFVFGFGYEFELVDDKVSPSELQRLLAQADGKPEERMINYALLRCMKQARYTADNLGHFGLASSCYCHFTSPIRRYPDLVVHRILKAMLPASGTSSSFDVGVTSSQSLAIATERLAEVAEHTSRRERVAMEAERDLVEMKKMQYMQQHLGEEFNGYIAGVTSFGFFVELEELFVEGLVHISSLGDDLYSFIEKQHSLVGQHSRRVFRIGDSARVKVAAVSPATRKIEFVLVSHSNSTPTADAVQTEYYQRVPLRGKRLTDVQARAMKERGNHGDTGRNTGGRSKGRPGGRKRG